MKGRDGVRGGDGTCGRTVAGALDYMQVPWGKVRESATT